jgi:hypothetical protein
VSGRSCGSSVVWAGRGEWNATRGLAVHGARGAQNTYRAHVEGSMGLITLIAVRCSPWCVFILPMHVFPADTYTYRPRSVTSPSRVSFYPRHNHAYMEKQIIPAISATIHCYSSPVPAPCPVQGPIDNGQIALSWHFSARNTRCHPPIACSPVLVPAFCGAARLANAHLVSECFFRVPPACSRPLFSPSTSAF